MQSLIKHVTFISRCAFHAAIILAALAAATARADTYTWDPDGTLVDDNGNWQTLGPNNWWNGISDTQWPSASTDTAVFGSGGNGSYTVTISGQNVAVGGMVFNSGAYTIRTNFYPISLSASMVPVVVNNGATPFINVQLTGTGGLSVSGGSLALGSGDNFTGNVVVSGGTLLALGNSFPNSGQTALGNPSTAGRTVTIDSGGVLQLDSGASNAFGGTSQSPVVTTIINPGGQVVGGQGQINYLGPVSLGGGTLTTMDGPSSANGSTRQSFSLGGGSVSVTAPSVIAPSSQSSSQNGLNLASTTTFNVISNSGSVDLVVNTSLYDTPRGAFGFPSGSPASLVKTGPGFMQLNAPGYYSGGTRVTAGTLQMNNGAALGSSSGALTANGGVLDLNGNSLTVGQFSGAAGTILTSSGGVTLTANMPSGSTTTFGGTLSDGQGQLALTLGGSGELNLAGNNTYTGATNVGGGTLYLTGSAAATPITIASGAALGGWGAAPAAAVNVNDGGILDFTSNNAAGTSLRLSSLIFNGGATFNLSDSGGQYNSLPAVNVGALVTSSPINVNVTNLPMGSGTVEIIQYSSGGGSGAFNLAFPVSSGTANYSLIDTGSFIDLLYTTTSATAGALYWTGTGDGRWNTTSPHAWAAANGSSTTYQDGNDVLFDNRGSAGTTVSVNAANVTPASVTFSNSGAVSYSLTGSFGIAGSTSVTVNGGGLVTFNNNNTYTGPTTITAGTLAIGGGGALGGGNYAGAVNNAGLLKYNSTASQTFSGPISGGGTLAQNGPGTVILAGSNSYTGPTAINGGVLNLAAAENPGVAGPLGVGGTIGFGGGTLQYSASNQYDYSSRFSTAAGQNFRVDTNNQSVTWAGSLTSNGGTLSKLGNGTLTVAGASNSYSGPTIVAAGTLMLGTIPANAPSSAIGANYTYQYSSSFNVSGTAGAPGGVMSGWNNFSSNSSMLTYNTGTPSGATVTIFGGTFPSSANVFGGGSSDQNRQLMDFFNSAFGGPVSVALSGIPYTGNYSIYAYLTGKRDDLHQSSVSLNSTTYYYTPYTTADGSTFVGYVPITNSSSSSYPQGNYAVFSGLSGTDQTLTFTSNDNEEGLAAIEIVPNSTTTTTLPSTTALQMGSGVFDLNGGNQQVASVSDYAGGGGSIINSNTDALATLTLSPTGTTTTYSGSILSGGTNGAISLVVNGNGTQVLSGTNTYNGGTWVEAGTLIATNNEAIADGSNLNVGNGLAAFGGAVPMQTPVATPATVAAAVPEPGTLALFSIGAIAALAAAWRRHRYATP